jgi:diguanylate cyclase (GGDEF)-like protein/PAS domain S-box-containing protein
MLEKLHQFILGTLRRQLIFGMTLTVALTMALFIWNVTNRQQTVEMNQNKEQAIALADSLVTSSAIWVASRDFSGLQEIVDGVSRYPNLNHAIVLGLRGQVLAHTDKSKVGLYITEPQYKSEHQSVQLSANMIAVTKAIMLADRKIGRVRISLDRGPYLAEIIKIRRNGLFYALTAILFVAIIASLASRYLTRRLNMIQLVADEVQAGANLRVVMSGDDEAALLARQFNSMLDSLAQREAQLASFYSLDLVGLTITSPEKVWISINRYLCVMLEYSEQELQDMTWAQLTHPDDLAADVEQFNKLLANEIDGYSIEKRFISRTGKVIPTKIVVRCVHKEDASIDYIIAMVEDLSQNKADAIKIEHLAFFDPLTQLPNRRLLHDRLNQALVFSARNKHHGAVLFLDLDHFKSLNDTLGHDKGDILLQQVAKRLLSCVREGDTVSRFGGDEFVILLEGLSKSSIAAATEVKNISNNILDSLNQPYIIAQHTQSSSSSMGVTLFLAHESSVDELIKQSDIAMYQAKQDGRNALRFFDPQMQNSLNERVALERDLGDALEYQQFQLYYQLQVDNSNTPVGAEALIRWFHPERGLVPPLDFIPIAEDSGIIIEIGQWVLDTACAQLKLWQQNNQTAELSLSVNVSAKQFHQSDFIEKVMYAVQSYDINPAFLKLELTESLLLNNLEGIIGKMNALAIVGIQFSLDDFGTGYSSLQYLKQLPLYQLKIDKSFVDDLVSDSNDQAIVHTIIAMAHSLGLNVIAEGVETKEQQQQLFASGCMHYQGYLFSKPVPILEFEKLLSQSIPA